MFQRNKTTNSFGISRLAQTTLGGLSKGLFAVAFLAATLGAASVQAQTTPPTPDPLPARLQMDGNGVELAEGSLQLTSASASVGPANASGLNFFMIYSGDGWRSNYIGSITQSGSIFTVSIGTSSEEFLAESGSWTSLRGSGSTLTLDLNTGVYTYTTSDGTTAFFSFCPLAGFGTVEIIPSGCIGYMTEMTTPNGIVTKINHTIQTSGSTYYHRVQSVTNNVGYQIHFEYFNNTNGSLQNWHRVKKATAINNSIDHCGPLANVCSNLTKSWPTLTFTYRTNGKIGSVKDALNRTTEYNYNASDELTGIEWPSSISNNITYGYNGDGRISSVNRGFGTWNYTYADNSTTRTTTVTNPENDVTTVKSQLSTGLVTSVKNGLNHTTTYAYDSMERLTSVTQPEGDETTYQYDSRGNVKEIRSNAKPGSGLSDIVTSATYPSSCANRKTCNKPTTTTDAGGHVTNYTYNSTHGGVTSIKRPSWAGVRPETRFTYATKQARYKNGASSFVTGGTVYVLTSTSECATLATCTGGADETKTTVTFPSSSTPNTLLPLSATTAAGNGAISATSSFTYTPNGDIQTIDGPLSGIADTTRFLYNTMRQRTAVISPDPDGGGMLKFRAVKTDYNTDGLPTIVQIGTVSNQSATALSTFVSLQQQETVYDTYNRAKETRLYDGAYVKLVSQVGYDSAGRVDCIAQRMNPSIFGSLPTSACTLGTEGTYGSDRIVKTVYDAAGQSTKTITAVGTALEQDVTTSTYTQNGLVKTVTDAKGFKTTYDYDGFDRLVKTSFPSKTATGTSSSTDYETISYYASGANKGLVHQTRRRNGSVYTNGYDTLRRLTSVTAPPDDSTLSFVYDNFNRLTQTTRGGKTLVYGYDQLSRVTAEAGQFGSLLFQYDAAGRRTSMTWPDNFSVTYDYDLAGALTKISEAGASTELVTFTYDDLGRRTQLSRGNGFTTTYGYDGVSRLATLAHDLAGTADDQSYGFTYNPASQITQRTDTNTNWSWTPSEFGTDSYTVDGLNQYLTAAGSSPSYDSNGNLTSYNGATYTYDSANRLQSATPSGGGSSVDFNYDPSGRLLKITEFTGSTYFRYDGGNMIAEYNGSGTVLRRYVHGPGVDEPLVWYEGSGTSNKRWLGADPRGSIAVVANGSGAAEQVNTYSPYGKADSTNLGRFSFTGQMTITEGGLNLHYYKARFYEPELGRFLQTDPTGYADGMNLYAYAGSDPVNSIDPSGLQGDVIVVTGTPNGGFGIIGGASGGGIGLEVPSGFASPEPKIDISGFNFDFEIDDEIVVTGTRRSRSTQARPQFAQASFIDPRYIQLIVNQINGAIAEALERKKFRDAGCVVQPQVTFLDPNSGLRSRIDFVARGVSRTTGAPAFGFFEVKTGGAVLSKNQIAVLAAIATGDAIPRGGNAVSIGLVSGVSLGAQGQGLGSAGDFTCPGGDPAS